MVLKEPIAALNASFLNLQTSNLSYFFAHTFTLHMKWSRNINLIIKEAIFFFKSRKQLTCSLENHSPNNTQNSSLSLGLVFCKTEWAPLLYIIITSAMLQSHPFLCHLWSVVKPIKFASYLFLQHISPTFLRTSHISLISSRTFHVCRLF